ncbi:hypothetical protein HYPSUDRAFT_909170 [Hypholoma sublateritium FD-334 SS-4]|uniref:Uncharacterized protein n=1 Tax=Hypholoma sublateritium (strain FD-334 SS-4) TaxID=945553 RepID=A0A0D2KWK2_HYPSF|nr:hypothetical protein HYPSUDRAFT_909170 [Hypholoma sublateritium FD-334 SS-4]
MRASPLGGTGRRCRRRLAGCCGGCATLPVIDIREMHRRDAVPSRTALQFAPHPEPAAASPPPSRTITYASPSIPHPPSSRAYVRFPSSQRHSSAGARAHRRGMTPPDAAYSAEHGKKRRGGVCAAAPLLMSTFQGVENPCVGGGQK